MPGRKAFPLRLDPRLYDDLRRWAEQELRSVNAQIEFLLRQAVDKKYSRSRNDEDGGDGSRGAERPK